MSDPLGGLLAVMAHPDDEVFRCGGTLALLARRGVLVHLITATRGQAGSCGDPSLCSPAELGALREQELRCSCRALGIAALTLWDYADGTLLQMGQDEAVAAILAAIVRLQPLAMLTMPGHGLSGHPDHIAVSTWAGLAYAQAQRLGGAAPRALYHLAVPHSVADQLGFDQVQATPDEQIDVTVDVGGAWEAKLAAIRCHRTQGETRILHAPLARQRLFLGREHFVLAAQTGPEPLTEWLRSDTQGQQTRSTPV